MSVETAAADHDDLRQRVEDLADRVAEAEARADRAEQRAADAEARVEDLEAENEALRERVEDLEAQPNIEFDGDSDEITNLRAVDPDEGCRIPVGLILSGTRSDVNDLDDRVYAIETDQIDPGDVLDLDGTDNDLPIQRKTAERKSGAHDLSKNKERATFVWPEFQNRAQQSNGQFILASWQVRNVLEENGLDTNPATVRRVMQFVAELTSKKPKKERDPEDEDNLVTFSTGESENTLRADKDEWQEFFEEQMDRIDAATDIDTRGSEVTR